MVPLVCAVFNWDTQMTLLSVGLAASCAGGVCGDHLSPISDTTIMASAGAHCFHLNHVATQLPMVSPWPPFPSSASSLPVSSRALWSA